MSPSATANQGRQVVLATQNVPPPHCIYLTQADQLNLFVAANLIERLRVTARIILPDGSLSINQWDVLVNSGIGNTSLFQFGLSEGFLLSVTVTNQLVARRGQVYARIQLLRGGDFQGTVAQILSQGYITFYSQLFWPDFESVDSVSGIGNSRSITGTTPAAGAEISETVATGLLWRPQMFGFKFTTSGVAGNRQVAVSIDDGVNIFGYIISNVNCGPGAAFFFLMGSGFPVGVLYANTINLPLPADLRLQSGCRIRTSTGSLNAGDQYSNVQYLVEEWISF